MATYGLLGLVACGLPAAATSFAAERMPNLLGEAFTRPMLTPPIFYGSDMSSAMAVSEPTDFESYMMLLVFFFCNRKFITSFSRSVFGSTYAVYVARRPDGGWQSSALY